jgi:hypothetical protein
LTNAVQLNPEVLERSNPHVWPRPGAGLHHRAASRCSLAVPMSCVDAGCWVSRGAHSWPGHSARGSRAATRARGITASPRATPQLSAVA